VGDRFVRAEFDALRVERAWLLADGTGEPVVGTGLLVAEGGGLALQESLEGAVGESLGDGVGDLLHRVEVDLERRAVVVECSTGDNFAPVCSELAEFLESVGGEQAAGLDASCQGVPIRAGEGFDADDLRMRTSHGKAVHDLSLLSPGTNRLLPLRRS
jgi:hypothetical protein